MLLDYYRVGFGEPDFIPLYLPLSASLGLAQAALVVCGAVGMYSRPADSRIRTFASELFSTPRLAAAFLLFVTVGAAAVLLSLYVPTGVRTATDYASASVYVSAVSPGFAYALVAFYIFLAGYPAALLGSAARKVRDPNLRKSILMIPLGWAFVAGLFLASEAIKWFYGMEYSGFMYLANVVIFSLVVRRFTRAAALAGFVKAGAGSSRGAAAGERQSNLPMVNNVPTGASILLMVDPATSYERSIGALMGDLLTDGQSVFLFTTAGSRLKNVTPSQVKTYLGTPRVSYVKPTENPAEVLLPEDNSILLDVLDKTYTAAGGGKVAVFYDSLSDMIVSKGFESTYKFLKQAVEMGRPNVTAYFMLLKNAHEPRTANIVSSQFSIHLLADEGGIHTLK